MLSTWWNFHEDRKDAVYLEEARVEFDYLHEDRKDAVYLEEARVEFDYPYEDRKDAVYLVEARVEFDYLHEDRKDAVYLVEARAEVDYLHKDRKDAVYLEVARKAAVYLMKARVENDYMHEDRKDAVYLEDVRKLRSTWWRPEWKLTTCMKTERMLSVWRMPDSCCLPGGGLSGSLTACMNNDRKDAVYLEEARKAAASAMSSGWPRSPRDRPRILSSSLRKVTMI